MDLGISTWSLPWSVGVPGYPQPVRSLDVYGLIDTAVDHGIGVVQVADNLSWLDWPETELDRVKEAVAARNISLELGTRGLDPLHLARCARVDTRMGFSVVGRPAGEGRVDFDAVLGQLRSYGRDDVSVIIEHWPPFVGTIDETVQLEKDWLARSIEFLRPRVNPTRVVAAQKAR
jgi:hypothetical protein